MKWIRKFRFLIFALGFYQAIAHGQAPTPAPVCTSVSQPANASPFTPVFVNSPYDSTGKWVGFGAGKMECVTLTDDAYWAAQPPAVQAIRNMTLALNPDGSPNARETLAENLALAGNQIDVPIEAWGWDPTLTMAMRIQYGYTWVPSGLQSPVLLPPGLSMPGLPSYDPTKPPAGSIKVSVNVADFAPVAKQQPTPAAATNAVGPHNFGDMYYPGPGSNGFKDGQQVIQNGVTYTFHLAQGMMGASAYFTQP